AWKRGGNAIAMRPVGHGCPLAFIPKGPPGPPPAHPAPRSTALQTPPAPPTPGPAPDGSPAPSGGTPCTAADSGPTRATRAGRRVGSPGRRGGTRPASGRSTSPGTDSARTSAHAWPCSGIVTDAARGRHGSRSVVAGFELLTAVRVNVTCAHHV